MIIRSRRARPDTYTKLLIKAFGANGSTTFKDFSQSGHTITAVGNAQMSTTQVKFPPVSMSFDGTGDYLSIPDSADWYFGTGNFTIDFWVRLVSVTAEQDFVGQWENGTNYWRWETNGVGKLFLIFVAGGVEKGRYITTTVSGMLVDTWHHLAAVRNGTTALMFLDGVSKTLTETTAFSTNDVGNMASSLYVGSVEGPGTVPINGYLDQLRVSKDIARWTSNFTPPTRRY